MKKHVLLVAAALGLTASVNAQDKNYLPEAGDWGLGFDANPLINYVGNMFNGTTNNSMNAQWENGMNAIMGKYFLDESTAARGWIRLGFGSTTDQAYIYDDQPGSTSPDPNATVTDETKSSYSSIVIGGGIEKRKGGERLQGYYGGELLISLGSSKTENTYGNPIADNNTTPTTYDFTSGTTYNTSSRELSRKNGSSFGLGVRGFIGVEFFILPKISIGAEYGWGLAFNSTGDGEVVTETWDFIDTELDEVTTATAGGGSFGIDTDNNGGAIRLMFHF